MMSMSRSALWSMMVVSAVGCSSAAGGGGYASDADLDSDPLGEDASVVIVEPEAGTPPADAPSSEVRSDAVVATECKPACTGTQVCVNGKCESIPTKCPCPKESYCDLATSSCKVGCLDDTQCSTGRVCDTSTRTCRAGCLSDSACGTGNICDTKTRVCRAGCRSDSACGKGKICDDAEVCVEGCRSDTDCGTGKLCDYKTDKCVPGCRSDKGCASGQICDTDLATPICRTGCRDSASCPMESFCDYTSGTCKTGCDSDDTRCNKGRICDSTTDLCRDGCRTDDSCALESYCSTSTQKCVTGCSETAYPGRSTRCPDGKACVSTVAGTSSCQSACGYYFPCQGSAYGCQNTSSGTAASGVCRPTCKVDADCGTGLKCTLFTSNKSYPSSYPVYFCAKPCTTSCTGAVYSGSSSATCSCDATSGTCKYSTSTCYQTSTTFGL